MPANKIVYIKWIDSYFDRSSYKIEEIEKQDKYFTLEDCGFLIEDSKDCIKYASSYVANEKTYRYIHAIPKISIIRKKIIKI